MPRQGAVRGPKRCKDQTDKKNGSEGGIRTPDTRIMIPLL
jgi:hypothetical protein